jgi:two-component system, sensor histidine kinase and response regulator
MLGQTVNYTPSKPADEEVSARSICRPAWMRFFWVPAPADANLEEKKRTGITNLAVLFVGFSAPFFVLLNALQGQPVLAAINAGNGVVAAIGMLLLRRRYSLMASLVVICGTVVFFTLSALLYRNGMEYSLLTSLFAAAFMFESALLRISAAILSAGCFLWVRINEFNHTLPSDFPLARYATNLVFFLCCYYILQDALRRAYTKYHRHIEEKNTELAGIRRQLEQEQVRLMALTEELHAANHAKNKLFTLISHDLRSPVAGLSETLHILNAGQLEADDFKALVGDLSMNVGHVHECLDTLLVWSASQLRGITAAPTTVFLADAADGCIGLLAASASRKKIMIKSRIPDEARGWADEHQVHAVLRNLVANAVKFTPAGGAIEISAIQEDTHWRITVADNGTGMPAEKVRDLFLTWPTRPAVGTENEAGLGLGLMICRDFVQSNGGVIAVASTEGAGSRFDFTLPAAR